MMKQAIILALAGLSLAVPVAHRHRGDYNGPYGRWNTNYGGSATDFTPTETSETVTVTTDVIVIPVGYTDGQGVFYPEGPTETVTYYSPGASSAPEPSSPAPEPTATAEPSSTPVPSSTPSTGGETGYMAVVAKWRAAGGLPALTQSDQLQANALKTATDDDGTMHHELNPGSMAQVLAPGNADDFEKVYVGGWLCEEPDLPGLNGICSSMAQGWDHSSGEKGHAEILTSTSYTKIGCALATGIWACDLA